MKHKLKVNLLNSFFLQDHNKKSRDKKAHRMNSRDKKNERDLSLFQRRLFKGNDNDYTQSSSKKNATTTLITPKNGTRQGKGGKYRLVLSNQKLKYLNEKAIDSFLLPECLSTKEEKKICLSQPPTTKNKTSQANIDMEIEKRNILKKVNKLLLANVNKTKIYSLYMNNKQNDPITGNQTTSAAPSNDTTYTAMPFKKHNKVDHLLLRMTMPQECFEEHLTEKDLIPQDKYTKFKRLLLRNRENVVNRLEDLKRTQSLNDTLIKVYTAKLLAKKYKYRVKPNEK